MAIFPVSASADALVFSASGSIPSSIQGSVDAYRSAIGNPNNGNGAGTTGGRREINWDGGGATTNATTGTPLTAFLNTRGALFSTPGTGFTQSPLDATGLAQLFAPNPTYTDLFQTFSPFRIFTPVGSNLTDVTFFIPGTNGLSPATVSGFGAVFSDVDFANSTSIQFFDISGGSLGTFFAPNGSGVNQSLSFLGVLYNAGESVFRVRITTGTAALSPSAFDSTFDLVVMDDVLYPEPTAIPEPSSLLLVSLGIGGLALQRSRRKKENAGRSKRT